jgi:hypothetical protein
LDGNTYSEDRAKDEDKEAEELSISSGVAMRNASPQDAGICTFLGTSLRMSTVWAQ